MGGGYGRRYNANMQKIIDTTMLPYFKQERYEAGIVYGTQAIMQSVKGFWFELYCPIFLGGLIVLIPILFILPWGRFTGRLTSAGENSLHYLYDKEEWDGDFVSGGDFSGFDDDDSGATREW